MDPYDISLVLIWCLVALYAAILVVYLRAEAKNDGSSGFVRATALKFSLSCLFTIVGILGYSMSLESFSIHSDVFYTSQMLVVLGLACCIPGDFFLQYINLDNRKYCIGIACFLAAQVLFLLSLAVMDLLGGWVTTIIIAAVILVCVAVLMRRQQWVLGRERILLTIYTVFLVLMASKAFSNMLADVMWSTFLMFLGAALFLTSDIILGIWNYRSGARALQNANWLTYFAGTMLIALSLCPAFDLPIG